jgi:hypothetical protein
MKMVAEGLHHERLQVSYDAYCYVAQNDTHGRPASRDATEGYEPGETGAARRPVVGGKRRMKRMRPTTNFLVWSTSLRAWRIWRALSLSARMKPEGLLFPLMIP